MFIYQAHALLAAAERLEAANPDIELSPFDSTHPDSTSSHGDDYMTGSCEYDNGAGPRIYYIDLLPGPLASEVTARVRTGYRGEGYLLLDERFSVRSPREDGAAFDTAVPERIADRVAEVIRGHEKDVEEPFSELARDLNP